MFIVIYNTIIESIRNFGRMNFQNSRKKEEHRKRKRDYKSVTSHWKKINNITIQVMQSMQLMLNIILRYGSISVTKFSNHFGPVKETKRQNLPRKKFESLFIYYKYNHLFYNLRYDINNHFFFPLTKCLFGVHNLCY